ncbi:sulfotransferase family protein [Carboxylicivirga linearis]|uniref:Sulfotransferase n=1 Tax=Carboxylicivirga linearis TaxID=1628157 RepID=A0ABS5K2A6_9BACT|nr:sulfotransferase [Carboxylicivirga linearis]MBS2100801.1 sulfotransferase [Carboxylicivirga linearis]
MIKLEFSKLPVTPLFGSRYSNFKAVCSAVDVDKGYKLKYRLSKILSGLMSATHPIENYMYKKKVEPMELKQDPVFILGHWRSGTTFLHNVLAQDKQFGYNTTYQTIFSNAMVFGQPFFKPIMKAVMPDKRPTDNLELLPDQPQEEEFALSNIMPVSFYNFWFLPKRTMEYCRKYLLFDDITKQEKETFNKEFVRLVKTSLYNTGGEVFLSKNPPHTGRVKDLLEIFPNAKFIYLVRNPYTVFESTRDYFSNVIKPLKLQDFTDEQLEKNILDVYNQLTNAYERDKKLIPEGNLYELRFEDFEADAFNKTYEIYQTLGLNGFDKSSSDIQAYLNKKKKHKKKAYNYHPETVQKVNKNWMHALTKWNYEIIDAPIDK